MNNLISSNDNNSISLTNIEETFSTIKKTLEHVGLPSEKIFAEPKERLRVFKNFDVFLDNIPNDKISESFYVSKFLAAVFAGLFDAALNYLWDETIKALRNKIAQYDIMYFYDVVLSDSNKRKDFKDISDIEKLSDGDLLLGALKIDLIDDVCYQELKHISYMRNWASAAHPNEQELTGSRLVYYLEVCVKNIIALPIDSTAIEIQTLLRNIRQDYPLDRERIQHIALSFSKFKPSQINALCQGFFGIYTDTNTSSISRDNINELLEPLWEIASEETKIKIGLKYGNLSINGENDKCQLADAFLKRINGLNYIPEDLKSAKLLPLLDDLINAHENVNNFYTEPSIAKEIAILIKSTKVPSKVESEFITKILYVYLTNGNGEAWNANGYYEEMLYNLSESQAIIGLTLLGNKDITRKLRYEKCINKFKQFLDIVSPKITNPIGKDLIDALKKFPNSQYINILVDKSIKLKMDSFRRAYAIKL